MPLKPFSQLLGWVLLLSVFTLSVAAQEPITTAELLTELMAISTLLDKAQTEYQATSDQLKTISATLAIVSTEEIPLLKRQITDSKHLFNDYRAETAETIRKLRIGLFALGAGLVISFFIGLIV